MFSSNLESSSRRGMCALHVVQTFSIQPQKGCYIGGGLSSLPACLLELFLLGFFENRRIWCYEQAEMNKVTFETNNTGSASESFPKAITFSSCSLLKHQSGAIKLPATGG